MMSRIGRFRFAVWAVLWWLVALMGCQRGLVRSVPGRPDVSVAVSAKLTGTPDAVVLSEVGRLRFLSDSTPSEGFELVRHIRLRVLSPGGRHVGQVAVALGHWTQLISLAGRSYSVGAGSDESVAELASGDVAFVSVAPEAGMLYSEARVAIFDIPGVDVGDIVEYEVWTRERQAFALPMWQFDREIPVLHSRFEIDLAPGWELGSSFVRDGAVSTFEPQVIAMGKGRRLVWDLKDVEPIEEEPFGLSSDLVARQLRLTVTNAPERAGVFGAWEDVGAWYRALTAGLDTVPAAAAEELEAWAGRSQTDRHRAVLDIHRFVRDRIRYVAIHKGLGAFQPHSASQVYETRFGDCKDMANLLVALFGAHGIEAFPALVSTRGALV